MSDTLNYNPALPESRQFAPAGRGGKAPFSSRASTRTRSGDLQPRAGKLGSEADCDAGRSLRAGR